MAMNSIDVAADRPLAEEIFRLQRLEGEPGLKNGKENGAAESGEGLALAPLVDKIAYGIARGLVIAMKELENHIASETRKVGDTVGRRLDVLQAGVQDLTAAMAEQRAFGVSLQQQMAAGIATLTEADARQDEDLESLRQAAKENSEAVAARIDAVSASLTEADTRQAANVEVLRVATKEQAEAISARIEAATASLADADTRQAADLEALRAASKETSDAISARVDTLCRDLGVQQEDLAALKSTLGGFTATVEVLVARLDKQADTLRTMCAAYAQRETELGSLVDGLARLRAYPVPAPTDRL